MRTMDSLETVDMLQVPVTNCGGCMAIVKHNLQCPVIFHNKIMVLQCLWLQVDQGKVESLAGCLLIHYICAGLNLSQVPCYSLWFPRFMLQSQRNMTMVDMFHILHLLLLMRLCRRLYSTYSALRCLRLQF